MGVEILPNAHQEEIVRSVSESLGSHFPLNSLTRGEKAGELRDQAWRLARTLGWLGVSLPEAVEGAGYTAAEEMLIHHAFGKALAPVGLLAGTLAGHLLAEVAPGRARSIVLGEERVGFAIPMADRHRFVLLDADDAASVLAVGSGEATLHPAESFGERHVSEGVDPGVTVQTGRLTAASSGDVSTGARGAEVALRARLLVAAQQAGIAGAASEMAAGYAKVREQFGRPIGAFQAVAHHCADMALRAEAALAQALFAAISVRDNREDAAFQVLSALVVANDAAFHNSTMNIRVHGGMGYSAECAAHLYLKRTLVLREVTGGPACPRRCLLAEAGPL